MAPEGLFLGRKYAGFFRRTTNMRHKGISLVVTALMAIAIPVQVASAFPVAGSWTELFGPGGEGSAGGTMSAQTALTFSSPVGSTYAASQIAETSAVLKGSIVQDGGLCCEYRFAYWKDGASPTFTDWRGPVKKYDILTFLAKELTPDRLYHFRIDVRNGVGTNTGYVRDFVTAARITITSCGSGSVVLPGEGQFSSPVGTKLGIEARAEAPSVFVGWYGTAVAAGLVEDPTAATTTVVLKGDMTLQAAFAVITVARMDSMVATGDLGKILSMNGIDVHDLVLGTTTFPQDPCYVDQTPPMADDFDLSLVANAESQHWVDVNFAQAVTKVFLVDKGGNDTGSIVPLDVNGVPIECSVPFAPADFNLTLGYTTLGDQPAGGLVITATVPIYGIRILRPNNGPMGIAIASVSAVPQPILTLASGTSMVADKSIVLSMDAIDVSQMVLGTTTFSGAPLWAGRIPSMADNLSLKDWACANGQAWVMTAFPVPVNKVFYVEHGGNDDGFIQALDANGRPLGAPATYSKEVFWNSEYRQGITIQDIQEGAKVKDPQMASLLVISSDIPIYGVVLWPPDRADPTSQTCDPTVMAGLPLE